MKFLSTYIPRKRISVFLFTLVYTTLFSIGFVVGGNWEFAIYTIVMLGALFVVLLVVREFDVPNGLLWALSCAGVLDMLGGGAHVNGDRLYDYIIYPFYLSPTDPGLQILRFDQFVHFVGYGVIALCIQYALRRYAPYTDPVIRALLTVFATTGIGAFNEMAEFSAVVTLSSTGVGDYANTLLDLISNTLGAIVAVSGFDLYLKLKKRPE